MGGIGKTQICLKFKDESEDYFECIFWIDLTSEESAIQSLKDLYKTYTSAQSGDFSANAVLNWISFLKTKWLMIYDNADGAPEVVEKFLPPGNKGNILITSRNQALRRITRNENSMEVTEMSQNTAIELLLKASGLEEQSKQYVNISKNIVTELYCVPLAIAQAGAYIMSGNCDITEYPKQYMKYRAKLMDNKEFEGASKYHKTVYGTWEISFQMLVRMSEILNDAKVAKCAITIIHTCAFFHHRNIPIRLFKRAANHYYSSIAKYAIDIRPILITAMEKELFHIDDDNEWDEYLFNKAVSILLSLALIKKESVKYLSLHPLIQLWCQDRLHVNERMHWIENASGILSASISYDDTADEYKYTQEIALHVLQIVSKVSYYCDTFNKFAIALKKAGNYKEVQNVLIKIVENNKELIGENDPDTLSSINNLAYIYCHLGKWNDAEALQLHVFDIHTKLLGSEHSDTLTSMGNLATTYLYLGKWKEAEELQVNGLEIQTKLLGGEHQDTLTIEGNLASTYTLLGKLKEAEELQVHVLDRRTNVLGSEHPDTLKSMNNLATTYSHLGKWNEAEVLHVHVLEISTKLQGVDHPDTLTTMGNLAAIYANLGQWNKAEELQVHVSETHTKQLGSESPDTLKSIGNLAVTYSHLGKYKEAEVLQIHVLEIYTKLLGDEHPNTLTSINNLASTYFKLGKLNDAEALEVHALETSTRVLGSEHLDTLTRMNNLTTTYSALKKWNEAQELQRYVLDIRTKLLGVEHPDALASMGNLALTYSNLEKWNESEELQIHVLEMHTKLLGANHPSTLTSINNLASTFYKVGKLHDAEKLQEHVLEKIVSCWETSTQELYKV
ncbi:hypothetical protein BDQ17DRAFT_727144 [Cyathus striatus]|nr:hypothetical protein BDQ17DRAFT_727144 [Cyathus striatus]